MTPERVDAIVRHIDDHVESGLGPLTRAPVREATEALGRLLVEDDSYSISTVHVPAAVHHLVGRTPAPLPFLAGGAALFLAVRIIDDLMDGDQPFCFVDRSPAEMLVVSQLFSLASERLIVSSADGDHRDSVIRRYRAMIGAMAEGQLRDERSISADLRPDDVRASTELKSGALLGSMAAIAAVLAGGSAGEVRDAQEFGIHLGAARQYANDIDELFSLRDSDRRGQKCTLVLALALSKLDEDGRSQLVQRLAATRSDADGYRNLVRHHLMPSVRTTIEIAASERAAARRHAERLGHDGTLSPLAEIIDMATPSALRPGAAFTNQR